MVQTAAINEVKLLNPSDGEILKGTVTIRGNTDVVGAQSYVLEFGYENGTNDVTWFLITESDQKVAEGVLATWDTQKNTDGDYRLRLTVIMDDDKPEYDYVKDLKVRNYTQVREDEKPAATLQPTAEIVVDETDGAQADGSGKSLWGSMLRGMLYTVLVILILAAGLWFYTQTNRRKRRQRRR